MCANSVADKQLDWRGSVHYALRQIYATMNLSRLFTCSLCLTAAVASAEEYWASGIYESGGNYYGWYDVDKTREKDVDDLMCYAASASNLVAWWQDGRIESGLSVSPEAPTAAEAIWGKYKSACIRSDEGGITIAAVNWWLSGTYLSTGDEDADRSVFEYDEKKAITLNAFSGYYYDQYSLTQDKLEDFFDLYAYDGNGEDDTRLYDRVFADLLEDGAGVSLALLSDVGDLGHAVTLWGAEYADDGVLSRIWLTDSDDYKHQLFSVDVNVDEGANKIYFTNPGEVGYGAYEGVYIGQVYAILPSEAELWGIPEPNAATLAALMGLVGVAVRRRRRK